MERPAPQEGTDKSFDMFDTCLLKEGGRRWGQVHPLILTLLAPCQWRKAGQPTLSPSPVLGALLGSLLPLFYSFLFMTVLCEVAINAPFYR